MIIYDCDQGTPEWFAARMGIPTASMMSTLLAKGRGGGESKTRQTYLYKLLGERETGEPADNYTNHHMERGHVMEAEARDLYALLKDEEPQQVGFVRMEDLDFGASPDSLVGDSGLLEIKSKLAHLQLEALFRGTIPPEHVPQVQAQIWAAEREWCDFVSYWRKLKPLIVRVPRDEAYIHGTLRPAVERFLEDLTKLQQRYGEL